MNNGNFIINTVFTAIGHYYAIVEKKTTKVYAIAYSMNMAEDILKIANSVWG